MNSELERVRSLARQVREIAESDQQQANIRLWTAVNDRQMIHPVVIARDYPRILLSEKTDELTTICTDPLLKQIESDLLLKIYEWKHLRGHRVIEPTYGVEALVEDTGFGLPMPTAKSPTFETEHYTTSKHYSRQIDSVDDISKIKTPGITYRKDETENRLHWVQEAIGDILTVKLEGRHAFFFNLYDNLLSWLGLEEGMVDMALNPDFVLAAADRLVDAFVSMALQYEKAGLLSSNNRNVFIGNGGYGYTATLPQPTSSGLGVKLRDMWGSAQDQILTSVSPEMSRELAFEREVKWTSLFDRVYYGCCERLDNKIGDLKETFPNLAKISVSPYADLEAAMEKIGSDFVVSFKPNSNYLAVDPWNKELLKEELIRVCSLARKYNCHVEILMKTIISLADHPESLWEWTEMATDIVSHY